MSIFSALILSTLVRGGCQDIGRELAEKKGRFTNREVFRIVEQEMGRELSLGERRKITGILKRYFHEVKWEEDRKGGKHLRWVYFE